MAVLNPNGQYINGHASTTTTSSIPNGHPTKDTLNGNFDRHQIVDEEKKFTQDLNAQIKEWGLLDAGFNYNLVAVFGSQSTGKSTLLNRLFGTNFDVMQNNKRQQTTKGIWMCRGHDMNVMVMDVEGTDGRERGEDQDFERKSALFSLASSEVMIVNLWEHQVGLYQGANMGLLKTVFEVNLGLFGKKAQDGTSGRTLILFVVRDYAGETPFDNLTTSLKDDLDRIWESLVKPAELKDVKLGDYFDLDFTHLPHKIHQPERFEQEVQVLRSRFVDRSREDFLFKPLYHKRIPADGVSFYMSNIWEQVQSNKDLDLPTQQELLAQFRCDEIAAVALSEFNEQAKSQKRPVEAGNVVPGLGGLMHNWRQGALERYNQDASRYNQAVYKRKQAELLNTIDATLSPLFLGQLKNLHKQRLGAFKKALQDGLKGEEYNYADVVKKARSDCIETFSEAAQEACIEGPHWSWQEELELLEEEIKGVADQFRKDETKKMVSLIERTFKKAISEPVEVALTKASTKMWDIVLRTFKERLQKAEASYLNKAISFNCTEEENTHSIAALRKRTWLALREKINEQTGETAILGKLRAHFEERFRYDEQGTPRVWQPEDDIDGAFKKARDETMDLIPRYAKIETQDPDLSFELPSDEDSPLSEEAFDFEESLIVLSETKSLEITNKFKKESDAYFVEAKRSTVVGIAQIPTWMYGLLLILGWNEAMFVLFNPLYLAMMLILGAGGYIILQLGLAGPVYQVARTVGGEVQRQVSSKLREHFTDEAMIQQQQQYRPQAARNGTSTSTDDGDDAWREELNQKHM
ncbi:root hair defective 3 GTP-binding protein [Pluteus cervinus]|uniref:Root hair defective 3 GTP-binding protein n=1 Tax=Pluteus cervinus TaxID=181527 RepID=A0ACD3AXS9_9AGAR|nr:root hair defective 3 GTP-binding protein [Pluteus cervinus]